MRLRKIIRRPSYLYINGDGVALTRQDSCRVGILIPQQNVRAESGIGVGRLEVDWVGPVGIPDGEEAAAMGSVPFGLCVSINHVGHIFIGVHDVGAMQRSLDPEELASSNLLW